jgi:hypothetical protein
MFGSLVEGVEDVQMRKKRNVRRVMGWLLSRQLSDPGAGACCALSMLCGELIEGWSCESVKISFTWLQGRDGSAIGVWRAKLGWSFPASQAMPQYNGYFVLCNGASDTRFPTLNLESLVFWKFRAIMAAPIIRRACMYGIHPPRLTFLTLYRD